MQARAAQIPSELAAETRETRKRILRVYITACIALGPGYAAFFALFGAWWSFPAPVAFSLASLIALFAYRRGACEAAARILVMGLFVTPAYVMLQTGALYSPVLIWLTPTPFMAGALAGRRAAVVVGTVASVYALLLGLLPIADLVAHEFTDPFSRRLLGIACSTTAVALLTLFGFSATKSFEDTQAKLAKQHAQVVAASKRLDERNRGMRAVLDHVQQGLMVIDLQGRMGTEVSRAMREWFGEPESAETSIWEFASRHDADIGAMLELGWQDLNDGFMPAEVVLEQMPRRYTAGRRTWSLDYRGLGVDPEAPQGVLLVMTEITERLDAEREQATCSAILGLFEGFMADRDVLTRQVQELDGLIQGIVQQRGAMADHATPGLLRDLHTVKGNAALLGVEAVARVAHERSRDSQCGRPRP